MIECFLRLAKLIQSYTEQISNLFLTLFLSKIVTFLIIHSSEYLTLCSVRVMSYTNHFVKFAVVFGIIESTF